MGSNYSLAIMMIRATMGSTINCVIMMVTSIKSSTSHMAMIISTNHMVMITVVMGFRNGVIMGPSSAINCFLILLKLLPRCIHQFVQESFIIFQNL
jgi:hypothetical protein